MLKFLNWHKKYRPSLEEIPKLDNVGLEMEWLNIKADLIRTSPYKNESYFSALYNFAYAIFPRLLDAHRSTFDPHNLPLRKHLGSSESLGIRYFADSDGIEKEFGVEGLVSAAFFAYSGMILKDNLATPDNQAFACKVVERLIAKDEPRAYLLKGIMLKHGVKFIDSPKISLARKYLQEAEGRGLSVAKAEISSLTRYAPLADLRSAHAGQTDWV